MDRPMDVVTIGETMLRFTPEGGRTLEQAISFRVDAGGAESNVAIALSRLGFKAAWISRLPDNPLGRRLATQIRAHGVDVSRVLWTEEGRVGVWYFEPPVPPRPGYAYYDRAYSAFSQTNPDLVDWDFVRSARWLHLTGITPALSSSCRTLIERALQEIDRDNTTISFDVNYRSRLWRPTLAREVLTPLLSGVHIVICSLQDARVVFGEDDDPSKIVRNWQKRFGSKVVIITAGDRGAVAYDGEIHVEEHRYPATLLDPLGAGDAFAAGFIAGYLEGGTAKGLQWAAAMAALKQSYLGDFVWCTRQELEHLISGGTEDIFR
jgi:2-dehydro-3-deoxygluconokinase